MHVKSPGMLCPGKDSVGQCNFKYLSMWGNGRFRESKNDDHYTQKSVWNPSLEWMKTTGVCTLGPERLEPRLIMKLPLWVSITKERRNFPENVCAYGYDKESGDNYTWGEFGEKVRFLHLVLKESVPYISNHGYIHPKTVTQHSIPNLVRTLWDNFANQTAMWTF